ncbi:MAG: Gfo/Idh/MocA family oxidoreductase [Verrucomicrobiota bacterium]|jgi:predicted dehydrogenase|nr:Gfo/Idh/MocA family oxidoreductase [Verrucomicrobiota bacterium]MEE2614761.1 Gfo/Idh/MocA family oxidoreductase [Verrucomicrobiota bacterium]
MIRLALISSSETAKIYSGLSTRLHRATWTVFAPLDSSDLSQALGSSAKVTSTDDLFSQETAAFDAVVIDADSATAESVAKTVVDLGKPVLVGAISQWVATIGEANALLMPAHPWRFIPSIQAVKRSVDDGKLGVPGLLRIHRWHPSSPGKAPISERLMPDVDLACWLFGDTPESVWSLQSAANEDYLQFHLGFTNGGMAIIDLSASLPSGGDYYSLTMIGGTGAAYADDHHNMNLLYSGGQPNAIRTNQGHIELVQQLQEFVDVIDGKREQSISLADTFRAVQVVEQVLESANSCEVVKREESK